MLADEHDIRGVAGHINGGEGHGNRDGDGATTPTFVLMDSDPAGSKIVGTAIKIEGVEDPAAVAEVQVLRLIDQGVEQGRRRETRAAERRARVVRGETRGTAKFQLVGDNIQTIAPLD